MNKAKRWFRDWLLKEKMDEMNMIDVRARGIVDEYDVIRGSMDLSGKEIHLEGITALLGNLNSCHVTVEPHLHPRIVLSELTMDSAITIAGSHCMVRDSIFQSVDKLEDVG